MVREHRLSKAKACQIAGLARTALYRERVDRMERDAAVVNALNETVERHGRWDFLEVFPAAARPGVIPPFFNGHLK